MTTDGIHMSSGLRVSKADKPPPGDVEMQCQGQPDGKPCPERIYVTTRPPAHRRYLCLDCFFLELTHDISGGL